VWYTLLSADPTTIIKGDFLAQFKTFTKQADVEKMLQNAALKDIKIKTSDPSGKKDYDDSYDVKFIQGTMSPQAVCYLLHQAQVSSALDPDPCKEFSDKHKPYRLHLLNHLSLKKSSR
jgi:hypothetical protein